MKADVLKTLRDIDGVQGSFLASGEGALLARDLPAVFSDQVLSDAGTRVGRLSEALSAEGPFDWVVLRFAEHQLFLKALDSAYLAIIAGRATNLPALKMAASLVAKRLPIDVASAAPVPVSEPPPTVASAPAARRIVAPPEAKSIAPASSGAARSRIFRGRRVES